MAGSLGYQNFAVFNWHMTKTPKMITKTLALAAVSALALGLSACGDTTTSPETTPAPTVDTPAEVPTTVEETPVDEATPDEATTDAATPEGTPTGGATDGTQAPADPVGGEVDEVTAAALTAIQTAESETGGIAYAIDDQDDDTRWEVEVSLNGLEVEVTLSGDGTTVEATEDDDDLDADERQALQDMQVTLIEGIEIAYAQFGGVLDDAELDEDDGRWTWEIDLGGANDDIHVDIITGEVVSN